MSLTFSCRSPMAEAVFKHKVQELGFSDQFHLIESFGTGGWHVGESPDSRSASTCRKHGVPVNHAAQQISSKDFARFDYVIGMDEANRDDLMHMKPRGSSTRVAMFGEWKTDPQYAKVVLDPYYGGRGGFEVNFNQILHFSEEFLKQEVENKYS